MTRCTFPLFVVVFFFFFFSPLALVFFLLLLRVALGFSVWCQWSLMLVVVNHCLRSLFFFGPHSLFWLGVRMLTRVLRPEEGCHQKCQLSFSILYAVCVYVVFFFWELRDRWELGLPLNRTASKWLWERPARTQRMNINYTRLKPKFGKSDCVL